MDKIALCFCFCINLTPISNPALAGNLASINQVSSADQLAIKANKQTLWQERKKERTLQSLRTTLSTLEDYRRQAIPQVSLPGQVRTILPKALKLITVKLASLQNTELSQSQHQELQQFHRRFETLKVFFQRKQTEPSSPAQHQIRFLHRELNTLEQPDSSSRKWSPSRRLSVIRDITYRTTRIFEQDPNYPLAPLLKRIEPLAKEYVIARQRLLEMQAGYQEWRRALAYLHSAESLIEDGAAPQHEILNTNVSKAAAYLTKAKALAPDYFNPTHIDTRLVQVLKYTEN